MQPVHSYKIDGEELIMVRLTAKGNQALCEVCYSADQKAVWKFPSYKFIICKDSLSITQIHTARASYVNTLLITSHGLPQWFSCDNNSHSLFVEDVHIPGYWGGSCAGCKWKNHVTQCSYADREEKYEPSHLAALPHGAIEDVED